MDTNLFKLWFFGFGHFMTAGRKMAICSPRMKNDMTQHTNRLGAYANWELVRCKFFTKSATSITDQVHVQIYYWTGKGRPWSGFTPANLLSMACIHSIAV